MADAVKRSIVVSRFGLSAALVVCVLLIQGVRSARAGTAEKSNPAGVLGQYATTSSDATGSIDNSETFWDTGKEPANYSPEELAAAPKTVGEGAAASTPASKPLLIPTPNAWSAGIVGLSVLIAVRLYRRIRSSV